MVSLCDDLLRLTRGYLDYAAIVQGSRPLSLGSFTIGALVDEIARQFAPIALSRQIHLTSHAEVPESVVVTDASRCQQIFGNLVSNAHEIFTFRWRSAYRRQVGTDSWSLNVSDSGPGIPDDAVDKVFEPFFRLARDEYSGSRGMGWGWRSVESWCFSLEARSFLSPSSTRGRRFRFGSRSIRRRPLGPFTEQRSMELGDGIVRSVGHREPAECACPVRMAIQVIAQVGRIWTWHRERNAAWIGCRPAPVGRPRPCRESRRMAACVPFASTGRRAESWLWCRHRLDGSRLACPASIPRSLAKLRTSSSLAVNSPLSSCSFTRRSSIERLFRLELADRAFSTAHSRIPDGSNWF